MENKKGNFYWLDWLRFFAAFNVLLGHARATIFLDYYLLDDHWKSIFSYVVFCLVSLGNEAVTFFFVLSGFLVGGKALERICNRTFNPINYFIDRFSRIMLPLVPALLLTAFIGLLIGKSFNPYFFVGNLFSLQGILVPTFGGNGPLWSLSYEVWFYVLVGMLGVCVLHRKFSLSIFTVLVFIAVVFSQYLSVAKLFCWIIGVLAYVRRPDNLSLPLVAISITVMLLGIIGVQVSMGALQILPQNIRTAFSFFPPHIVLAAGIAIFIQQVILIKPKGRWMVRVDKYGVYLAAFSYTLYLTHQPVLDLISAYFLKGQKSVAIEFSSILGYIIVISICLIVSYIVYWLFERRTHELRSFLKKKNCASKKGYSISDG